MMYLAQCVYQQVGYFERIDTELEVDCSSFGVATEVSHLFYPHCDPFLRRFDRHCRGALAGIDWLLLLSSLPAL